MNFCGIGLAYSYISACHLLRLNYMFEVVTRPLEVAPDLLRLANENLRTPKAIKENLQVRTWRVSYD